MNQLDSNNSSIERVPVVYIQVNQTQQGMTMTQTYPVRITEDDKNDFIVQIRASVLRRNRTKLTRLRNLKFSYGEVLLGTSTLLLGASLSGLASKVELNSILGIIFYLIFPLISIGTAVAYGFYRKYSLENVVDIAQDMLDELPDPERTS